MHEAINAKSTDKKLVKTLFLILFIKLFLVFVVLKVFFFPNFLNERFDTAMQKSDYVGSRLTDEPNQPVSTP